MSGRVTARVYNPHIQMVPFSLWKLNLRGIMKRWEWRELRLALLENQGPTCAVCKKKETGPARVYAHEEWDYVEKPGQGIAQITGVTLLCWHCHAVEHWGHTNAIAVERNLTRAVDDTMAHFCRVNNASEADFHAHASHAVADWNRRNDLKWNVAYGPFERWVVPLYERDPLNHCDWPQELLGKYGEMEPIAVFDLVSNMISGV